MEKKEEEGERRRRILKKVGGGGGYLGQQDRNGVLVKGDGDRFDLRERLSLFLISSRPILLLQRNRVNE